MLRGLAVSTKSYKQNAKFGIGETSKHRKAKERKDQAAWIKRVREKVFQDRPNCQICHGARWDECLGLPDQLHEDPPRSKTRGLPMQERFNPRVCGRLCAACHKDVTEHRLTIWFEDETLRFQGFIGEMAQVRGG